MNILIKLFWKVANTIRGYNHDYGDETPKGCCPYPINTNWSARSCIKRGECRCGNGLKIRSEK